MKELRQACEEFGFFQIINHNISSNLQDSILHQSKKFFDLPIEIKETYSKGKQSLD
jgi:isopenicillin N synthase-like dioxygenase